MEEPARIRVDRKTNGNPPLARDLNRFRVLGRATKVKTNKILPKVFLPV
jgi:hypothetical protein